MAYADPEKRRAYHRDYQRMRRGGICQTPGQTQIPSEFRIKTARDVLNLLAEQIEAVRNDEQVGTLERARCIGYLGGIALKAVEIADLSDRVEAVEKVLTQRKEPESCEQSLWPNLTDKLNPRERLQLVLAAHARQDAADVDRLLEACAMKTYRMRDANFGDAYEAVSRMNMAVLGDIGARLAEFRMMQRLLYAVPAFCVRAGFEIEQEALFGDAAGDHPAAEDELPPPPQSLPVPDPDQLSKGRELVDSYSEHRLPKTLRLIGRLREHMSASIAAEVKGLVSGYERFTRPVLGMGAVETLQATDPEIAEALAPVLALRIAANPLTAGRVAAAAAQIWQQLSLR